MSLINTLVSLIILAIVGGLLWWCVTMLPLPNPVGSIVRVLVVLLFAVVLLGLLFGVMPLPRLMP